eukprot:9339726-Lingulodinium_polyedra.AAC.1
MIYGCGWMLKPHCVPAQPRAGGACCFGCSLYHYMYITVAAVHTAYSISDLWSAGGALLGVATG